MELKLYNTLTRKKEVFAPIDPANVRMYVCGPTVYDYAHIGNARPAIVFDVLFRLLRHLYGADHVTYVRNITDVDDKINARALRDFPGLPLNEAIAKVTRKTEAQYHADVAALGCLPPTHEPHATAHIPGMVAMIQTLIDKGCAYVAKGGEGREVLFDVAAMPQYGQLSKRRLEEQQAGARVAVEAHKKNPADFVLWKESSAAEPGWDGRFRWQGGEIAIHGRPGWHIECSVMSAHHLGETFDIHGGGLDLIFPHHENEIAQSRCAHGADVMANYWMHNGFLQVEGRKMSKSEGNFVTIHELLETEKFGGFAWPGIVLRYAMLMTNYREPIDFSVARLEEASIELGKFSEIVDTETSCNVPEQFLGALADDLNTPAGISYIRSLASGKAVLAQEVNGNLVNDAGSALDHDTLRRQQLAACLEFLGVAIHSYDPRWMISLPPTEVAAFVDTRLAFIREKNWAEADRIRDELLAQGIQLKDGKDPATGERVTTWEVKR